MLRKLAGLPVDRPCNVRQVNKSIGQSEPDQHRKVTATEKCMAANSDRLDERANAQRLYRALLADVRGGKLSVTEACRAANAGRRVGERTAAEKPKYSGATAKCVAAKAA